MLTQTQFLAAQNDAAGALTCFALLITPIQRVPRYLLLLKELIKATPKVNLFPTSRDTKSAFADDYIYPQTFADYEPLERAIRIVQDVAVHINEHIRERENLITLRELDLEFPGLGVADKTDRVLVYRLVLCCFRGRANRRVNDGMAEAT